MNSNFTFFYYANTVNVRFIHIYYFVKKNVQPIGSNFFSNRKNKLVYLYLCQVEYFMDGQSIPPEKLAILGLEVTRPTATSLHVSVVPFHLMLDLDLASGQFSVAAPQSLFSGKFSGLCGAYYYETLC